MGTHVRSMKPWGLVLAFCIAIFLSGEGTAEDLELVEEIQNGLQASKEKVAFSKIEGMALKVQPLPLPKEGGKPTFETCKNLCVAAPGCGSFSYNRQQQKCFLSQKNLEFNP